jgi:ferredoxin-nitrite reductase
MGGIGLTGTKVKDGLGYNITLGGSHLQVGEEYKKGVPLDELKDVLKEILIERFDAKLRKFPHL